MIYNTKRKGLPMPEYGRAIQNMVDYALTIKDRGERQKCANTIIAIMGNMFPQLRDIPDFEHKLWDNLAIMSDFKLDIDYPYEVIKRKTLTTKPTPLPYSQQEIEYRHYGKAVVGMLQKAVEFPDTPDKDRLIYLVANQMKKDYNTWNKDGVDDQKIFDDILNLTNGAILITPDAMKLETIPPVVNSNNVNNNNAKRKGKNKNHAKSNNNY